MYVLALALGVYGQEKEILEAGVLGEISTVKDEMQLALDTLYGRRLVGWAAERSNYSYLCVNETWWSETVERDATITDEYELERRFHAQISIDDDEDDYIPAAHPPHHPHPHHPHPHHPHRELKYSTSIDDDEDDFIPAAHPPHHPHPHHPHPSSSSSSTSSPSPWTLGACLR
uniref:Uncharacterized protein n=1 Tax=Aureoumbra lagunensis TaxID=44058 RepID=A0A7S3JW38_9STRA